MENMKRPMHESLYNPFQKQEIAKPAIEVENFVVKCA
jgi:hypothetical protein